MRNIREFFIVRSWSEDALFPRGQGLNGIGRDLRLRGGRCRDRTQQQQQDWPELRSVHLIPSYNGVARLPGPRDRKSTRLNSSHEWISYAVFCLKKKKIK